MNRFHSHAALALVLLAAALTGCTEHKAQVSFHGGQFVNKPDVFLVRPFAVDMASTAKDQDVIPAWILKSRQEPHTPEDARAGQQVAATLVQQIVTALEARGIHAAAAGAAAATANSVHITGQFVNAESSTGDLRPAVGYRAGKKVETRVQLVQSGRLLAELAANASTEEVKEATADIGRQIADVVVQAYVNRGWLPPPPKK